MKRIWFLMLLGAVLAGCQSTVKSTGTPYEELEVMASSESSITIRFSELGRDRAEERARNYCGRNGLRAEFAGFEKKFGMSDIATWRCH